MVKGCILTGYGEEPVQMTHQWEPVMRRGVARHWCPTLFARQISELAAW